MTRRLLPLLTLCAVAVACGRHTEPPVPVQTAAATSAEGPTEAPTQDPVRRKPLAPITSRGNELQPGTTKAEIEFDLPSGWTPQPPDTAMRVRQAEVPGPGGPAEFAVFYFGPGGGGSTKSNIDRWIGQIDKPKAEPARKVFLSHGLRISTVDVAGTLKASTMGTGMGPQKEQPASRLLAAVVEGPGGPWFFKATGADATLAPQREPFLRMLESVHTK